MIHIVLLAKHLFEKVAALAGRVAGYIKTHAGLDFRPPVISAERDFKSSERKPETKLELEHGRQIEREPAKAGVEIGPDGMRGFLQAPELIIRKPEKQLEAGG